MAKECFLWNIQNLLNPYCIKFNILKVLDRRQQFMFLYFFKKKIVYIIKRAQYQDRAIIL